MLNALDVPSDGPAEILAEAVRRLGLRYSRAHVRGLLERQEQPGSLLALVRAAPELGLKATAGQGDLETLDALEASELPVLLHFQTEARSGFGLLEAVSPPGVGPATTFRLWDSQGGRREWERGTLASLWSGVVVFLEREGVGEPEPGHLRQRARELLFEEWRLKTALAGPASSPGVRLGLALGLAALLGAALLAQPPGWRLPTALLAVLASVGGAASLAALAWTRGESSFLCGGRGPIDCESVLLSSWARPAGVPLAGLGTAFFGALLLLLCTPLLGGGPAPVWLVGAAFLLTLPLSGVLVMAQARMRRVCTLCMGVHAVDLSGAAVFLLGLWRQAPSPPEGTLPAALLGVFFFGLLLSTLVPLVSRGSTDAALVQEHARLMRSPLATLARLSQEPRRDMDGEALGPRLGEAHAPHVLVVFAHPACVHCGALLEELEAWVALRGDRVRIHVALAPLDPQDPGDAAACEALAAAGVAWGGEVFLSLFRAAKRDYTRLRLARDPLALVAFEAGREPEALVDAREEARARVQEAATFKQHHVRGLPAVFLDGRRCEAPLEHVATWLDTPALLDPLSPPAPAPAAPWQGAHAP